jgi:hypothetical protein
VYKRDVDKQWTKVKRTRRNRDVAADLSIATDVKHVQFNFTRHAIFEELSIAAHHYTDILYSFILENKVASTDEAARKQADSYKGDILQLRRSIFDAACDNTEAVRASLIAWDNDARNIEFLRVDNKTSIAGEEGDATREAMKLLRNKVRTVMVEEFLMMLKKAAEAGNDLFGASEDYVEKVTAANKVFKILTVSNPISILIQVDKNNGSICAGAREPRGSGE